ncbi:MAG: DUF4270 domain-containing protein, partial [Rikenellaceae bacterium]|nr:DUF4270 domain-containing protein [Rikenellaceae bacterium]
MMICSRVKPLAVIVLATLLAAGCTQVDDTLGMEFIPEDQQLSTRIATIGEDGAAGIYFETRLAQMDSIPTSQAGAMMIGATYDPIFGYTTGTAVVQPTPYPDANTTSFFGYGAVADSMWLNLEMSSYSGNTLAEQSFTIYELNKKIHYDSICYANFDGAAFSDMARPLFHFTHTGTDTVSVRLRATADGQDYMNRLLARDLNYVTDTVFLYGGKDANEHTIDPFYGLYIVPDNPQADAAMYQFSNLYAYGNGITSLVLCSHNYNEDKPGDFSDENISDTTYMSYTFDPYYSGSSYTRYSYANPINCIARNYAAGSIGVGNINFAPTKDNATSTPKVATAYVQGLNGVYTLLTLTEALKDKITELAEGKNLAIEAAMLYLEVEDPRPPLLDAGFTRLGMYENYGLAYTDGTATDGSATKVSTQKPIPDYNPTY